MDDWICPDWPAPAAVRALQTTRIGGVSQGPYASLNLGHRVSDDTAAVAANRARVVAAARLPAEPAWLEQVHGAAVVTLPAAPAKRSADAAVARTPGQVCAVLTADCLPVLLCADDGTEVASAHAGWRGLSAGVVRSCVECMHTPAARLMAWLGPAIGPRAFEVGPEVREAFVSQDDASAGAFVEAERPGKFFADLYALARRRLELAGVTRVYGGGFCTYGERARFFSYRRDGECGRMASLIWLEP